MILEIINNYASLKSFRIQAYNDDGPFEKLVRKFSAIMMIVLSSVFLIAQLVGKKIQCWCPNEYSDPKCDYAITHCYLTELYIPLSNSTSLPNRENLRSHKIIYYQWIPFILFLQAVIFYFPSIIWRCLYSKSGFDIHECFTRLRNDSSGQNDSKDIYYVTNEIERNFLNKNRQKSKLFNSGFYLAGCYNFTKFLYTFSILLQLYILNNWFKDEHYHRYNWITSLFNLEQRFPRKLILLCLIN